MTCRTGMAASPPAHQAFDYDALGRVTAERLVGAGGSIEQSREVRHDGLTVTQVDALGRARSGTRNAWGPLAEVVDPLGGRTRYEYDAFGGLLRVRDALGIAVSTIAYNPRGMKLAVDDMNRGAWTWTRNALGEITAVRDAKGQVSQFNYDALGRPTQRTNADGTSTWTWGAAAAKKNVGRLVALSGPGYSESLLYDVVGRPATHTIAADASYRFDFAYNALGLLDDVTYPSGGTGSRFRIRHDYEAGRVTRIRSAEARRRDVLDAQCTGCGGLRARRDAGHRRAGHQRILAADRQPRVSPVRQGRRQRHPGPRL